MRFTLKETFFIVIVLIILLVQTMLSTVIMIIYLYIHTVKVCGNFSKI